jgi:hypothetical protein
MRTIIFFTTLLLFCNKGWTQSVKSKMDLDREAIRSMAGIFKVTFDFTETFSPDTSYKHHHAHHSKGIEYVFVLEETERKIVLQHLLIVGDTMIVKHWRQDWIFENAEFYKYEKENTWMREVLSPDQVRGSWTQRVFQVDDSPRYEGRGTWIHADGRHFWQSVADSPLPRREFTTRDDYNVLRRHSHYEILADGWIYEQDNEKMLRTQNGDKLICWEKGIERMTRIQYNFDVATNYWKRTALFWQDVRTEWDAIFNATPHLKINKIKDGEFLYAALFALEGKLCMDGKAYESKSARKEISKVLQSYVVKVN